MAGSAVVGALRVTLGLDSAQFTSGMKSAQTGLQRFGSIAKAGALAIGAAMLAAGTATAVAMKGIIDEADKMSKLSQSIGVPIGELSRLKYAADLAGVDIDALGKAIKRLSANMLDSTETATGPAARAFTMLGISVRDASGNMKPASQVIADLSGKFAQMPDGVEKTALAMRIFGKTGADMIPLLNGGADAMQAAYQEAEQLGLVLDENTGKAAEAFNDNLTRLGKVQEGIVTQLTAAMLPAFLQISDALVGAAKNTDAMKIVGAALGWTLKGLVSVAVAVGAAFIGVASDIGAAWDAANRFVRMDFKGGVEAFQAGTSRTQTLLRGAEDFIRTLWSPPSGDPPAVTRLNNQLDLVAPAANRATRAVNALTDAQREASQAAQDLARDGARTFEETRTPLEQYTARMAELGRQYYMGAINLDTLTRALKQAQDAFDAVDPAKKAEDALKAKISDYQNASQLDAIALADDQRRSMQDATYDGIRGGLEAAANGNLGQYLANRLRTALMDGLAGSLTSLLSGGGKKGGGGGGGIFGSIAGLFGVKLPGFKTGGSFKVGGAGGPDSQITAFRSTPGEMVDVRRPGQTGGGGAVHFDLRGAVMTSDLLRQMQGMAAQTGGQAFTAARQVVPSDLAKKQAYRR